MTGCEPIEYCKVENSCNYENYSGNNRQKDENCIFPTQNLYGYYSGNTSYGSSSNIDSSDYADSLNSGITSYYDCSGYCLEDSDGDGVCDFMDDIFNPNIETSAILDIMEANGFDGNPIDFGEQAWIFGNLEYLNLSNLGLTIIPSSIGNLTNLESLVLSYNNLTSVPPEISDLYKLEHLLLDYNQLISLPDSLCDLLSDCGINFQFNQLCEEYHYSCIDMFGGQEQSNCCEGPNGEANWMQCEN